MADGNPDQSGLIEVKLHNENLRQLTEDHLYHVALSKSKKDNLKEMFGDVKFVCFGGTATRMEQFASFMSEELGIEVKGPPKNYAGNGARYVIYKAGPVLSVDHGIGIPSLSVIFEEILKLVQYAGCENVTFFRIGTSGGLDLDPGTVVVTEEVFNGALEPVHKVIVLGKTKERAAVVDATLVEELANCSEKADNFKTVKGKTLCADDFYEAQGRIDGAFCEHGDGEKQSWLRGLKKENGVTNMEMESLGFIAMCHRAKIKGAVCCVTLLDRFKGDCLTTDRELLSEWQTYPQILVARYIKKKLQQ